MLSLVTLIKMLQERPRASLPLQILIFLDERYLLFHFLVALMLFVYKGSTLKYHGTTLGAEITGVFLYAVYQFSRLFLGSNYAGSVANKTETVPKMIWFVVMTVPAVLGAIYYIKLQTYV